MRKLIGACVFAACLFGAAANAQKTYVLQAPRWGEAQVKAVTDAGGTVVFGHDGAGVGVATSSAPDFVDRVRASKAITGAAEDMMVKWQPDLKVVEAGDATEQAVTPENETFYPIQWAPKAVEAPEAWAQGCTGKGVRVAILDGGIHSTHIDLAANLDVARSASFVPGFNFNQDVGTFWHGTHVAGIVAAADNNIGTIGIAPEATLVGVKVLHNGSGAFSWIIQGILYAATPVAGGGGGADIINMSLGAGFAKNDGDPSEAAQLVAALNKTVNYANRFGVLVVSSAGNDALDLDHSGNYIKVPAESGSGIAVSATGPVGFAYGNNDYRRPASYTNYGNSMVNVAGPGGDFVYPTNELCSMPRYPSGTVTTNCWVFDMVMSTVRGAAASNASYGWAAGTSMAAPAVSGVAAIAKQMHPGMNGNALGTFVQRTADDEGKPGNDPFYGKGFVNARRACTQ